MSSSVAISLSVRRFMNSGGLLISTSGSSVGSGWVKCVWKWSFSPGLCSNYTASQDFLLHALLQVWQLHLCSVCFLVDQKRLQIFFLWEDSSSSTGFVVISVLIKRFTFVTLKVKKCDFQKFNNKVLENIWAAHFETLGRLPAHNPQWFSSAVYQIRMYPSEDCLVPEMFREAESTSLLIYCYLLNSRVRRST